MKKYSIVRQDSLAKDISYNNINFSFTNEGGTPNMSATIHNYGYGGSIIVFVLSLFLKTLTIIVVVVVAGIGLNIM